MNDTINESEPNDPQSILFPLAHHKGFLGKGAVCLKAKQKDHGLPLLPARPFFVNNVRLAWRVLTHSSFPISKQFYWEPDPELDQNNSGTSANLSCLLALAFTYSSRWSLKNFQVWATGEVDNTGKLNPINLLSHKLKGILNSNTSTKPKLVFAPLANFDDIQSLRQSESFEELEFSEQLSIEKIMSLAHGTQALVIWLAPNDLKLLLKWLNVQIGNEFSKKGILGILVIFLLLITVIYYSVFNPNALILSRLYSLFGKVEKPKIEWINIPEGKFTMGSERNPNQLPMHEVKVKAFQMAETEVTVGQYRKCVEAWVCDEPTTNLKQCTWSSRAKDKENYPINCLSWEQALTFSRWVGGNLPTEAQWEYAARGGEDFMYAGSDNLDLYGWHARNSNKTIQIVKTRNPNKYKLYDMSGNVWEWTLDAWLDNYKGAPFKAEVPREVDKESPPRVVRGGSVLDSEIGLQVTNRYYAETYSPGGWIHGFRPIKTETEEEDAE